MESNRERVLPGWIWELLQNARDVSDGNASLIASVEWRGDELTFRHNGRGFEPDEITHLIYYGSTKLELADPIGQFGTGFLATHLLSRTIDVSGHLTDGQTFAFRLDRSGESVDELKHRMDASFEAFKSSLAPARDAGDPGVATKFRYPIDKRASRAVDQGERALELAGPYVTAFNHQFKRIEFLTQESGIVLELRKRRDLAEVGIGGRVDRLVPIREVEVEVSARASAPLTRRSHVVAELDGVAVAIPFERRGQEMVLVAPTCVPKLLLGFPLIGTEDFSFPVVVHSLRFSPTEERDGVYLGQNDDQVNQENQAVIEQACGLLLSIAGFAAESGWSRIHVLAEVPRVREKPWLNKAWLRGRLASNLVDQIRATPLVLNELYRLCGDIHFRIGQRYLAVESLGRARPSATPAKPQPPKPRAESKPPRPAPDHPWRKHFQTSARMAMARRNRRLAEEAARSNGRLAEPPDAVPAGVAEGRETRRKPDTVQE